MSCCSFRVNVLTGFFFCSSRRRHTRFKCDWSSDVCSSDLTEEKGTDGTPPMSVEGKKAFLDAIAAGKGFIGCHCASDTFHRSEERRVGKECRSRWSPYH